MLSRPTLRAERDNFMTTKAKRRSAYKIDPKKRSLKQRKLPPDPDGLFKRAAARARKVIAVYEKLNPDADDHLVSNLVLDLICLSDRDPELGNVDEECVFALQTYQRFVAENMWSLGRYDDFKAAQEAAEQMMLSRGK